MISQDVMVHGCQQGGQEQEESKDAMTGQREAHVRYQGTENPQASFTEGPTIADGVKTSEKQRVAANRHADTPRRLGWHEKVRILSKEDFHAYQRSLLRN